MKVVCTGNPNNLGIASSIAKVFPDVKFMSRATGYDLTTEEGLSKFRTDIVEYDVFINSSQISPGTQEVLLNITREVWIKGHVFNIGSIAEYKRWEWFDPPYTDEKRKLRETSIDLYDENFKTTHIVVGGFKDSSTRTQFKMDPINIANTIKWVLECDHDVPIIGVERASDHKHIKRNQDEVAPTP